MAEAFREEWGITTQSDPPLPAVPADKQVSASRLEFFRNGGFDQVKLETAADLAAVLDLDPKLWVALSCPTSKLELDPRTIAFLDGNDDGRIRAPEVRAAIAWLLKVLTHGDSVVRSTETLSLSAIAAVDDEGRLLLASARALREQLNLSGEETISVSQVDAALDAFSNSRINGDGVLTPAAADKEISTALQSIIDTMGAVKDSAGKDGVDQKTADEFFAALSSWRAWWQRTEIEADLMPMKANTPLAFHALQAVRPKIDEYFMRSAIAAMDRGEYDAWAKGVGLPTDPEQLPLSRIEAARPLSLTDAVNPVWQQRLATFADWLEVPSPLSDQQWVALKKQFEPHRLFVEDEPKSKLTALGHDRLLALARPDVKAAIDQLFDQERAAADASESLVQLSKLLHLHRDLFRFANNFVAFGEFYAHETDAIFCNGRLYLDGRSCELCLEIDDVSKHAVLAVHSMVFLVYCDLVRRSDDAKKTIVAAMTNGSGDFVMVGRNGLYVDRDGKDWDATITRIIEQPISIREAFWTPYKRLARFIAAQIEKFAGDKDKSNPLAMVAAPPPAASSGPAHAAAPPAQPAATAVPATPTAPNAPAPKTPRAHRSIPPPRSVTLAPVPMLAAAAPAPAHAAAFDVARFAGIFAAVGLAVGAIGTAMASIVSGFLGLQAWQMPIALFGALLLISGPSMLLAAMKLRQRNLGPLLDACGWAINSRTRITIPFGESLTRLPTLPDGARRRMVDPFSKRKSFWPMFLFIMVIVGAVVMFFARDSLSLHLPWHWGSK